MGLLKEVWPFFPYVSKGDWKEKLATTGQNVSPEKTKLADVTKAGSWSHTTPGLAGEDGAPRGSRTASGRLSVSLSLRLGG